MQSSDYPFACRFRVLLWLTIVVQAALLGISLMFCLPGRIPNPVFYALIFVTAAAGCLFIAHLTFGMSPVGSGSRLRHVYLAATILVTCLVAYAAVRHHGRLRYEWFVREGVELYGQLISKVEAQRTSLTVQPKFLFEHREGILAYVSACTNTDGRLMVWIKPREDNLRLGYFYYSSTEKLTVCPWDDRNRHFLHLTNGWYEF